MLSGDSWIWRLLPDVRAQERSRFLFFAGLFLLISLGQTMGLAGAEALFLAELGIEDLAPAFVAAAGFTVIGSIAYATRVGSARNDTLFIQMLLGSSVFLAGGAFLAERHNVIVLSALFCFWYLAQAVFINHFWTFSGDFFDTLSSKRLVPIFTIGSSIGGVIGGATAALLAKIAGPASLILAWGATFAGAALLLVLGQRALRKWGPLELEEADETSVESLRKAAQYAGSSPLARWLVLSALGMVIAAFLLQYLYSDIFARRFPEPTELAAFFAIYFAVTNAIELLIEIFVTPRLIRRAGVPGANLLHPVLLLLSFASLAWRFALPAAIGARMAREMMDAAMAAPVRSLVQNAVPQRIRGRMRAFLEGIVVYAGMAAVGLLLIATGKPDAVWLCGVGATAALFYLFANFRARRAYLDTLVEQLKAGRLDFSGDHTAIGAWEASRLADLWEESLRTEGSQPSASALQLIPALAARGVIDPLVRAASHPSSTVRQASLEALASTGQESLAGTFALAIDDGQPEVRLAALRGLSQVSADTAFVRSRVEELLADPDARVRAEAAARLGAEGIPILESMIGSPDPAEGRAALSVAPAELLGHALGRLADPEIRAPALACVVRLATNPPLPAQRLCALLSDGNPDVRRAAVPLTARYDDETVRAALASRLADPAAEIRDAAKEVLGNLGDNGIAAIAPFLRADSEEAVGAALRAVAASRANGARTLLIRELRYRVARMWWYVLGYQHVDRQQEAALRPLGMALGDAILREWRLAFHLLSLLESPEVVRKVLRELRGGSARSRADALEVLANLGDSASAGSLALLHDTGPVEDRARALAGRVDFPTDVGVVVEKTRNADNAWVRRAGRLAAVDPRHEPLGNEEEATMHSILALKQVDLFADLSFEQLDAVLQASENAEYQPGEIIFREGEPGDRLFVLVAGSVEVVKHHGLESQFTLQTLQPPDYFGEMAILTEEPRSATTRAGTECQLLTLEGAAFRELIVTIPEISFEIFRVLTQRVRDAEQKLRRP